MRWRGRLRRFLLLCMGILFVVSIPWYRDTGAPVSLIGGFPDWVAVALACYVGVAVLNSLAWLLSEFEDEVPPGGLDEATEDPAEKVP